MMITHLQMITIYVSDLQRALEFYVDKLDFAQVAEFKDDVDHLIWLKPKPAQDTKFATQLALYSPENPKDSRIGAVSGIVFTSDDIEATYNELKQKGIRFTLDLIRHPYGSGEGDQEARFVDPDGNEFLLHT